MTTKRRRSQLLKASQWATTTLFSDSYCMHMYRWCGCHAMHMCTVCTILNKHITTLKTIHKCWNECTQLDCIKQPFKLSEQIFTVHSHSIRSNCISNLQQYNTYFNNTFHITLVQFTQLVHRCQLYV